MSIALVNTATHTLGGFFPVSDRRWLTACHSCAAILDFDAFPKDGAWLSPPTCFDCWTRRRGN